MKSKTKPMPASVHQARRLVEKVGNVTTLTNRFNMFRNALNLPPVQPQTVKRYVSGYQAGLPEVFTAFVRLYK